MDPLPLSALNDFLYCPRRAALKLIEGWRSENEHTVLGDIGHEHTDLPGYEVAKGVKLLRALPVFSERLGVSGKCDIVEVEVESNPKSETPNPKSLHPVEYKKGKRRQFENDDAQLCAQALCLEEMFACKIERGAIFHAASKRRREVEFTPELRALTEKAVADLRALVESGAVPSAKFEPRCEECSLYEICLPRLTDAESARRVQRFQKELWSA
ncbi:MAG TPA: CRISPR-associated protein Cas4 [Verrucomicrobiae bacterium]|nr:CRISPR-associated protein Cas4 [Verrucomicrobiae bacterium]